MMSSAGATIYFRNVRKSYGTFVALEHFSMQVGRGEFMNAGLAASFHKMSPLGRLGTADHVAGAITVLASQCASFITGDVIHVCGGTPLAP